MPDGELPTQIGVGDRAVLKVQAGHEPAVGLGDPEAPQPDRTRARAMAERGRELKASVFGVHPGDRVRFRAHAAIVGSEQGIEDSPTSATTRATPARIARMWRDPPPRGRGRPERAQSLDGVAVLGLDTDDGDGVREPLQRQDAAIHVPNAVDAPRKMRDLA